MSYEFETARNRGVEARDSEGDGGGRESRWLRTPRGQKISTRRGTAIAAHPAPSSHRARSKRRCGPTTKTPLLFALAVIALAGCGARSRPVPVTYSLTTFPEIGSQAKAGVGERLLTQAEGRANPLIVTESDQTIGDFVVLPGRYPQSLQNTEYATFEKVPMRASLDGTVAPRKLYLFEKDRGTKVLCVSRTSCAPVDYSIEYAPEYRPTALQQTLLYNGKIGNRITLSYREFSQDMARPAFTNEVTYDLSESKILGYKGARLEVLSATNTELTYRVLAGFDAK